MILLFSYVLAVVCLGACGLMIGEAPPKARSGLKVWLGRSCAGMEDNNRLLVIRSLPDGQLYLNQERVGEMQLRQTLRKALERRMEKIVWVGGDERLSYGDVVALIAKLQSDSPELHIAIATKSQIGQVDPVLIERMEQLRVGGPTLGVMPCVYSLPSN